MYIYVVVEYSLVCICLIVWVDVKIVSSIDVFFM